MVDDITDTSQTVAAGQLRAFVERIERLEEEKKTIADDIKEVYAEAKGTGFDTKAVRTIIRLRSVGLRPIGASMIVGEASKCPQDSTA